MTALPPHLEEMTAQQRLDHERDVLKILTADMVSQLLEDLGITQQQLADRLGSSRANVSRLLSGSQNLRLSTIAAVCHALGVRMRPQFSPADRAGTPAEHDRPLPAWVDGSDAHRMTIQLQVCADLREPGPPPSDEAPRWHPWSIRTIAGKEPIDG